MGTFTLSKATTGYDASGVSKLLNNFTDKVINQSKQTINNEIDKLIKEIDSCWYGASSIQFKNKLYNDSNIVFKTLENLDAAFRSEFNSIGDSMNELDAYVAAAILGKSYDDYVKTDQMELKMQNLMNKKNGKGNSNKITGIPILDRYIHTKATNVNESLAIIGGFLKFSEKGYDGLQMFSGYDYELTCRLKDFIFGTDSSNLIDENWMKIKRVVEEDRTKFIMDGVYSTKLFSTINDLSYEPFQRGNLGYKVGEGVGEIAGTVMLAYATGGTSSEISTALTTVWSGISGAGSTAQKDFQKLGGNFTPEQMNKVKTHAFIDGSIDAAFWYLGYGKGKLANGKVQILDLDTGSKVWVTASDINLGTYLMGKGSIAEKVGSSVFGKASLSSLITTVTQTSKNFFKEGSSYLVDGKIDVGSAIKGSVVDSLTNNFYNKIEKKFVVDPIANKVKGSETIKKHISTATEGMSETAAAEYSGSFGDTVKWCVSQIVGKPFKLLNKEGAGVIEDVIFEGEEIVSTVEGAILGGK